MEINTAGRVLSWYLCKTGHWAITLPWGIYILPEYLLDEELIEHELVHVGQMEHIGTIPFLFKYVLYQSRYGYEKNPLEIEAREESKIALYEKRKA
jgi:hypothetical protein